MSEIDIRPVGDSAILARFGIAMDEAVLRRVWAASRALVRGGHRGILDVVPAYASVLVRIDPLALDLAHAMALVRGAAEHSSADAPRDVRTFEVRVCFGGACGIDYESTAHELGMRERRMRDMFCGAAYRVAFLGFLAGFPYLVGLPGALAIGRLASPRPRVPAGSVAIAAGQCGIYPRESPGGWRLLGRTLAPLFDPLRDAPALFAPGDAVRFRPAETIDDTRQVDVRAGAAS